jgi:hypothetical protein
MYRKSPNSASFHLRELFPSLKFAQDVELDFPDDFYVTVLGIAVHNDYAAQILKFRTEYQLKHFFLGYGTESFVDSWAVFRVTGTAQTLSIMIQSRLTTTNATTTDCATQLYMCTKALDEASIHNFKLLIISDDIHFCFFYFILNLNLIFRR